MIIFLRLLPLVTSLVTLAGFEYIIFGQPKAYYIVSLVLLVVQTAAVFFIRRKTWRDSLLFVAAPLLLLVGSLLFFLFPEDWRIRQVIVVATSVVTWVYLEQVFAFQYHTAGYQAFALENISGYMNVSSVFCIVSGLFGLRFFIGYPLWLVIVVSGITLFLATNHTLAMGKIEGRVRHGHAFLIALLGTEVIGSLSLLPSSHFLNGLIAATYYFVLTNLTQYHLRSALDRTHVRRYVLLGLAVVVLSALTAHWR